MTDIQIKFWQLYEQHRANRVAEEERYRSNKAQEQQKANELIEANRHNVASEEINQMQAQISAVHANAAQKQAAVSARLAELSGMRYELEKTLNNAQVNKTLAEQAKIAAETSLTRSKQYLVEQQTLETAAKTRGQEISNKFDETSAGARQAKIYSDMFGDVIGVALNIGKFAAMAGGM